MKLVGRGMWHDNGGRGASQDERVFTRYLNWERSRRTGGPQRRMGGDAHWKLESKVWRYLQCIESETPYEGSQKETIVVI